jgi:hypothetical protein
MTHTIRIKKEAPRRLVFEVLSPSGTLLARSATFASICKLEAALSLLTAAGPAIESAAFGTEGETTWVRPGTRRSRMALEGSLPANRVAQLLTGIPSASVVDDRPPSERRADLSGRRCDLTD